MPDPSLKTSAAVVVLSMALTVGSCLSSSPPAADSSPTLATLTWTGDADLDLELHPLPPRSDSAPPPLNLASSPIRAEESVDGSSGESIRLEEGLKLGEGRMPGEERSLHRALPSGDYLIAARFWSVGPRNVRTTDATLTVALGDQRPAQTFTARLDDDSADLWLACIVSLPSLAITPVGETRVAGL